MAVVYRIWSESNELLYIGSSKSYLGRIGDHLATKDWAAEIASVTIEQFSTIQQAKEAETQAIANEFPKHNVLGACDPMYRDPGELIDLLNDRERRLLGGILFGLGSLRGPLLDEVYDLDDLAACLRHLGALMTKEEGPIDAVRRVRKQLERARLLGLGQGYKIAERQLPPTPEVREGILLANRHTHMARLGIDEEADPVAS